ncbi:MFS transporter [Thermicanus aegyptius]|uniref:MFS transporter n=1 Tax=Thermicanus aegyptius TaxID=94009 RepID=UPI0003FF6626|nr:MFS transporter [Thermicanus aegyptius]
MNSGLSLTVIQKVAYSNGNFAINLMAQTFATYAVFFYVDVLGVRPGWIGLAMFIHGIFNAFMNPIFGYISDRTHSRWGRRLPYIVMGILPLAAAFTMIWVPLLQGANLFWYFLITVLLYDIFFVVVVLNWTSLFPEMFTTLIERSFVSAWRQMFGLIGMILGVAIPPLLYTSIGWSRMGILFGLLILLSFIFSLYGSKENPNLSFTSPSFLEALRYTFVNKAFVTYVVGSFLVQFAFVLLPAVIPFYGKYVLKIPESENSILTGAIFIAAIPMVYLWSFIVKRMGPRKTILTAVLLFLLSLIPFAFVTTLLTAALSAIAIGISLAGIIILLDVLLAEVIDDDEKRSGARREGMYFGMNGFIIRWGISLQAIVMGAVLEWSGYVQHSATQPASVEAGIRLMMTGIPIASLLLALLFYYLYPLGRKEGNRN